LVKKEPPDWRCCTASSNTPCRGWPTCWPRCWNGWRTIRPPHRAALARPDREVRLRFTGLIAAREPWERALDSIEALLNPAKPVSVATVAKDKRMVTNGPAESGCGR